MAEEVDRGLRALTLILEEMPELLDERQRRILAGCAARGYGYGGIRLVSAITHMDARTIRSGIREWEAGAPTPEPGRVRSRGAGRKSVREKVPDLYPCIEAILAHDDCGDPQEALSWTSLSLREISALLKSEFHLEAGKDVVSRALEELGYRKPPNPKKQAGRRRWDAQFSFINETARSFLAEGDPVIAMDTGKSELVSDCRDCGKTGQPPQDPDGESAFPEPGKAAPYGVYPVNPATCFVDLGTGCDSGAFAVESIRRWWNILGKPTFPGAKRLYLNCGGGGGNDWRTRLWKYALAQFAEEAGIEVHVSHIPPCTIRWNRVVHSLFCFLSKTWAGNPLMDIQTVIRLISPSAAPGTPELKCVSDTPEPSALPAAEDDRTGSVDIEYPGPCEGWNYVIRGFQ